MTTACFTCSGVRHAFEAEGSRDASLFVRTATVALFGASWRKAAATFRAGRRNRAPWSSMCSWSSRCARPAAMAHGRRSV
jgi:hypothetical protein